MSRKTSRWCIVTLLLGMIFVPYSWSQAKKVDKTHAWADSLIRKVVEKIKASPEGSSYFKDVDPAKLQFIYDPKGEGVNGSNVMWSIEKEVKWVDGSAQAAFDPTITSNTGILLQIYVAFGDGDTMVNTDQSFTINNRPRVVAGYYLVTKGDGKALRDRMNEVIQGEIASAKKSVPKN